jgi:hypothetical protein
MHRTLLATIAITLVTRSGAAQVASLDEPPIPDSVRTEILEFVTSYYDAFSARDWDRFADHFWPGATITTIWQPIDETAQRVHTSTVTEFIVRAPEGPGSRESFEERMSAATVYVYGSLATVFSRYRARFGDPGDIMEWEGIDSFALMRFGDEWRIVALSFAADG